MEQYRLMDDGFEVDAKVIYFDWFYYNYNELKAIPHDIFKYFYLHRINNFNTTFND